MAKGKGKTGKPGPQIGKKPKGMKSPAEGGTKMVGRGPKGKKSMGKRDGDGDCM